MTKIYSGEIDNLVFSMVKKITFFHNSLMHNIFYTNNLCVQGRLSRHSMYTEKDQGSR